MPFVKNEDVRIYYEVEGQGPPILLAHGLTGNTAFWRGYGYVDQLRNGYTVILFDARGHGQSDKPLETAAYDYRLMVGDILAVLDALAINRTHYWGYSMGGVNGFFLASQYPEKLISLIGGGVNPTHVPAEDQNPSPLLGFFQQGVEEGIEATIEAMRSAFGSLTPAYEARLRTLEPKAMIAYLKFARTRPSYRSTLTEIKIPCLLYAGDQDDECHKGSGAAVSMLRNAQYISLPGLNHVSASAATDLIMPHVLSFLISQGNSQFQETT